ncbi:MAG: BatA and WFA domain-containing protein [Deinococcota bacterium]
MPLGFAAPAFLWALLGIPIVIALHFVRKRRQQREVSASFLWREAKLIAQRRRRFSLSWLLAAQIAFVALAALALARPFWTLGGLPARVIIMDASASMTARDSDGIRLDKAVGEAVNLLGRSGNVAVVRAGLDASVLQASTTNRGDVREALEQLEAGDAQANLSRAVDLATSLVPDADIHLFSDASAPANAAASGVTMHNVGLDAQNLGISAFDLRYQQAFVSVVSNNPRPQEVVLEIAQLDSNQPDEPGQVLVSSSLLVPASGQTNVAFPLAGDTEQGFYRASLRAPEWDGLELDNSAYAGSRSLNVLVQPRSTTVERALQAIPNVNVRSLRRLPVNLDPYDVVVLIGNTPEQFTAGKYILFPDAEADPVYETVADWDRSDPLMRFVDLSGVVVATSQAAFLADIGGAGELDWQPLAESQSLMPVVARATTEFITFDEPAGAVELVAFSFHPTQNDMVRRVAFPILITNIIEQYRSETRVPLGTQLTDRTPVLSPGLYDDAGILYTASLLSASESRLLVAEVSAEANTVTETSAQPSLARDQRRRNFAYGFIVVALVVLALEWFLWSQGRSGVSASA